MSVGILLTGGTGQVGTELRRLVWPDHIHLDCPDRDRLDLVHPDTIISAVRAGHYAAIISAAAYTAVDQAETDVQNAWAANALGPAVLARQAALVGIPILHLSTDYVFDGGKDGYYREDDPVCPINVYGASKEGGEQAVRTANPRHIILRTAWVVSTHGRNFLTTMLRLAAERDEVAVVADQRGCPTFACDLAAAIQTLVMKLIEDEYASTGTYHFVNAGEADWAEFAQAIFAESVALGGQGACVRRITTAEYPTPARRPPNSRLAAGRICDDFGVKPNVWKNGVQTAVKEFLEKAG